MTDVDPVEVSVQIAASPDTVFAYFTDPKRHAMWMGTDVVLDPVVDGEYGLAMRDGVEARGRYLEVDPPHRVVFTWGWANSTEVPPGSTRVEVTLTPESDGTLVVLRHHDLPSEQTEIHRKGWDLYLPRLAIVVAGGDPGPDPHL